VVVTRDPYSVILDQARASVAAGRDPDWSVLESRVKAVTADPRAAGDAQSERRALQQLKLLASVHRARARLAPKAAAAPVRRPAILRDRPTITGTMDVRRERDGDTYVLRWETPREVSVWELRISERTDSRGTYTVREERELPGETTSVELPLGELALRVHLIGRSRTGKLIRRAVMSSLTPESWSERWQRRASAA
jgi:hypothetical protein